MAAYALGRLGSDALAATVVTAVVGTVVVAALRRRPALAVTVGALAVGVSALVWGIHAATGSWVPTYHQLASLHRSLQTTRGTLERFRPPLPHTSGVLALGALVAGLAAVGGRGLGIRYPALSLVPAAALVVWSATLLPATGAALAGLVLGGCGFLVLGSSLLPRDGLALVVGGISLALAAVALGWTAEAGSGAPATHGAALSEVAPSALTLATDLTGVETRDAHVVLFRATTSVPTYWQVTSLTVFSGGRWLPDPATSALLEGSAPPQVNESPSGSATFAAVVTLFTYSGRLLPVPPSTVLASGSTSPVITPSGVVATSSYDVGSTYAARAVVPSPITDTTGAAGTDTAAADFTATGPLPSGVQALAQSITGGQTTVLDKAEALVDYFRSGRFRYNVDASPPAGTNPLVTFLTRTRTGTCEQFAGAFAMLARASGLPTRVAIGFTPGRAGHGMTVVRGSDAHAWPQVLMNGSWVSFEPTPSLPSGELAPPGVLGPAALGRPVPTTPETRPPVSIPSPTVPVTTPPRPPSTRGGSNRPAGDDIILGVVLALVGVAVVVASVFVLRRRRRRSPVHQVVGSWRSLDRALTRRGLARPRWRTPMGHVRDLATSHPGERARATIEDLRSVAEVLERASYGTATVAPAQADRVMEAGRRARRLILEGALSEGSGAHSTDEEDGPVRAPVRATH